ncbi:hypothetical protein [Piscinibacter koreensis]|uniref:Uncharacterized protein n=1 Tax=Piscinibacter koreensis TaxID=2742824 RepID=A0A7Y6NQZ8_9BURK|nr:hypothetical protein [Schlegelella koreensis]NUZ07725.1 hypothetical protein [Schlegelella koreensis]
MLTSLFGDLGSMLDPAKSRSRDDDEDESGFAATAIMQTTSAEVNERGQIVDRHLTEIEVKGSPAQAIREHFAATRADLETATSMITLVDPAKVWAASVIKALSDAGGRPIERLQLRRAGAEESLAVIERTTLVRRQHDTLRIFNADVRAPGLDSDEIPIALMERSQLAVVIIGPMEPPAIDALLDSLLEASALPAWRCPHLLFQLPPGAAWIAQKVAATEWSDRLQVHVSTEPMTGASAVWNAIVEHWDRVRLQPATLESAAPAELGGGAFPIRVGDIDDSARPGIAPESFAERSLGGTFAERSLGGNALRISRDVVDSTRNRHALAGMLRLEGLVACAIAEVASGAIHTREVVGDPDVDLDLSAATCAQAMQAMQMRTRNMGLSEPFDELIVSAGSRHLLVRAMPRHPELFVMALLEKHRSNLALARFTLMDVERALP